VTSQASTAATRVAGNHSPAPFANWGLSLAGDAAAPALVWLTMTHPLIVAVVVLVALIVAIWLARRMVRLLGEGFAALRRRFA